jgi:hypothetical protein
LEEGERASWWNADLMSRQEKKEKRAAERRRESMRGRGYCIDLRRVLMLL